MKTLYGLVRDFHEAFGHPRPLVPTFIRYDRLQVRRTWADEERKEFDEALEKRDMVGCADALADELYFHLGTCVEMGIDVDAILRAVHVANMAKLQHQEPHADDCDMRLFQRGLRCTCGKIAYNDLGKTMKPQGWTGPEEVIKKILGV